MGKTENTVEVTPAMQEQWDKMVQDAVAAQHARQYVLVEGGLVQYGSPTVDTIDIDFVEGGNDMGEDVLEEALHTLHLMNQHRFRVTNWERIKVVDFIRDMDVNKGLELHHPDCDRLNSWMQNHDADVLGVEEDKTEVFDCNLGCNEALTDRDVDLEQFCILDRGEEG